MPDINGLHTGEFADRLFALAGYIAELQRVAERMGAPTAVVMGLDWLTKDAAGVYKDACTWIGRLEP